MSTISIPARHDMVSFLYKGKLFSGEVRRVYSKDRGHLMIIKISEGKYRSCYLEECENFAVNPHKDND
jgi:hypothetical protein